jgi:hypothetical protein
MTVVLPVVSVVLSMVAVAQLVESRIVIPVVVGSSPISHPINYYSFLANTISFYLNHFRIQLSLRRRYVSAPHCYTGFITG